MNKVLSQAIKKAVSEYNPTKTNINKEIFEIKSKLLNYTKKNLTTEVIAKEVIERANSI